MNTFNIIKVLNPIPLLRPLKSKRIVKWLLATYPKPNVETLKKKEVEEEENQK